MSQYVGAISCFDDVSKGFITCADNDLFRIFLKEGLLFGSVGD